MGGKKQKHFRYNGTTNNVKPSLVYNYTEIIILG